jgi:hypothetical protein
MPQFDAMTAASPIEQFTIYKILPLSYNSLDFSFTNSSLLLAFSFFLTLAILNSI